MLDAKTALYCQASLGHGEEAKEALQRTSIVLWKKSRFQEVINVEEGGKFGLLVVVLVLKDDWCHDIVCRG